MSENRRKAVFACSDRHDKPNSVPLSASWRMTETTIYLRSSITRRFKRRSEPILKNRLGTALHRGKDLAVSLWRRRQNALLESFYPFGIERFCSHLAHRCGRALPATLLPGLAPWPVFGLSSRSCDRAIVCAGPSCIIPRNSPFATP